MGKRKEPKSMTIDMNKLQIKAGREVLREAVTDNRFVTKVVPSKKWKSKNKPKYPFDCGNF